MSSKNSLTAHSAQSAKCCNNKYACGAWHREYVVSGEKQDLKCTEQDTSLWKVLPITRPVKL